ncbi:MAG TPA: hypothetical protein VMR86_08090 [Myxococcota bacterium]|nr:hypothetical protein [Myxococcota bacterium]
MTRRSAARPALALAFAALLVAACSRGHEAPKPVAGRTLAQIWPDILEQRDVIHAGFAKPLEEVTHQDCADVDAAARKIDALTSELGGALVPLKLDPGRMRALGNAVSSLSAVTQQIRETALAEAPGAWPRLRFPLDASLRAFENFFSADDLGHQSVTLRPGFETAPLPAPLSPI